MSLYRSRWWGWEKVGSTGYVSGTYKYKARAVANWAHRGACHYYLEVGEFMIAGGNTRITSVAYNHGTRYLTRQKGMCIR